MIGIYSITNKINNKKYIGQSINIEERIKRHFRDLKSGCHHSKHLQNAFNKYGEENFVSEVLFECKSIQELDEKEIEFIKKINHEFRITTREISNILKTNNVIRFGENVYQLLVA